MQATQAIEHKRSYRSLIIVLLAVMIPWSAFVTWRIMDLFGFYKPRPVGDGQHVDSYGFDLSHSLIDISRIESGRFAKGAMKPLDDGRIVKGSSVQDLNSLRYKHIVDRDRVIGVVINGQARAYPLRVMNWHEVANDELGGVPIAVTYHPLCDSAVVFDRRVGGEVLRFSSSGLLYNSNQLMYDRRSDDPGISTVDGRAESLWSQLQFRAVTGPEAEKGTRLKILPMRLTTWEQWLADHPQTTLQIGLVEEETLYKRDPYVRYYFMGNLEFDVDPLAPEQESSPKRMERMVMVRQENEWVVHRGDEFNQRTEDHQNPVVAALWFAWYAMHSPSTVQ